MTQSKFDTHDKKIDGFFNCGKPGHYAKDCYKRKANEYKQNFRKHNGNYVKTKISINGGFKNTNCLFLKLHCLQKLMMNMHGS